MIFLTLEATLINELDFISYLSRRVLYASYVKTTYFAGFCNVTNPSGMLGEHEKSCQLQLIYKLFAFYCLKTKAVCQ